MGPLLLLSHTVPDVPATATTKDASLSAVPESMCRTEAGISAAQQQAQQEKARSVCANADRNHWASRAELPAPQRRCFTCGGVAACPVHSRKSECRTDRQTHSVCLTPQPHGSLCPCLRISDISLRPSRPPDLWPQAAGRKALKCLRPAPRNRALCSGHSGLFTRHFFYSFKPPQGDISCQRRSHSQESQGRASDRGRGLPVFGSKRHCFKRSRTRGDLATASLKLCQLQLPK